MLTCLTSPAAEGLTHLPPWRTLNQDSGQPPPSSDGSQAEVQGLPILNLRALSSRSRSCRKVTCSLSSNRSHLVSLRVRGHGTFSFKTRTSWPLHSQGPSGGPCGEAFPFYLGRQSINHQLSGVLEGSSKKGGGKDITDPQLCGQCFAELTDSPQVIPSWAGAEVLLSCSPASLLPVC